MMLQGHFNLSIKEIAGKILQKIVLVL